MKRTWPPPRTRPRRSCQDLPEPETGRAAAGHSRSAQSQLPALLERQLPLQHRHLDAERGAGLAGARCSPIPPSGWAWWALPGSIPFLFFTLFGGVIADRVDKRRLLMVTQTVMMVLAFLLAGLRWFKVITVWERGGHRLLQRRGHGDECAQLPGAGAEAGEARRPDQRHRAQLGAVQHVAHSGTDAGRLRHGRCWAWPATSF